MFAWVCVCLVSFQTRPGCGGHPCRLGTRLTEAKLRARQLPMMGRVTVFTADGCADCRKAKELLSSKGAQLHEISLTKNPDWRPLLFILAQGKLVVSVPLFMILPIYHFAYFLNLVANFLALFHKSSVC